MPHISLFELLLICVVSLVVLGPERLPGAIRTTGLWVGRLRRSFNSIRKDIEREIGADEIRRQLRNEEIMDKFKSSKKQFTETVDSVKKSTQSLKDELDISKQFADLSTGDEDIPSADRDTEGAEPVESVSKTTSTSTSKIAPASTSVEDSAGLLGNVKTPKTSAKKKSKPKPKAKAKTKAAHQNVTEETSLKTSQQGDSIG